MEDLGLLIYCLVDHLDLVAYYYLSYFLPWDGLYSDQALETVVLHLDSPAFLAVIVDLALETGTLPRMILYQQGHLVCVALDFELETFYLNLDPYSYQVHYCYKHWMSMTPLV